MRRVRDVLRLRSAGVGLNEIARRVGVAPSYQLRSDAVRPAPGLPELSANSEAARDDPFQCTIPIADNDAKLLGHARMVP